jgi:hypothetical protein
MVYALATAAIVGLDWLNDGFLCDSCVEESNSVGIALWSGSGVMLAAATASVIRWRGAKSPVVGVILWLSASVVTALIAVQVY